MNLNSNNVFRGPIVSIYMSADENDWILIDNETGEPCWIGAKDRIIKKYDEINEG